jgi:hypothetical protein
MHTSAAVDYRRGVLWPGCATADSVIVAGGSATSPIGQHAILEPSGTAIVIMELGSVYRPQAAFSLLQLSADPYSEVFLPDIAWTLDSKFLCALTTHGQLFVLLGAFLSVRRNAFTALRARLGLCAKAMRLARSVQHNRHVLAGCCNVMIEPTPRCVACRSMPADGTLAPVAELVGARAGNSMHHRWIAPRILSKV